MNKRTAFAAAALFALAAAPALAQSTSPAAPPSSAATDKAMPPAESDPGAASATSAGVNASVVTGMPVKDNTGATIGSVSDVKTDADGKQTATIKMGADSFAVDTTRLQVSGGAATVNASQSEIKGMLKKK